MAKRDSLVPGQGDAPGGTEVFGGSPSGGARRIGRRRASEDVPDERMAAASTFLSSRISMGVGEETNPYAQTLGKRHAMDKRARTMAVLAVGLVVAFAAGLLLPDRLTSLVGPAGLAGPAELGRVFSVRAQHLFGFVTGDPAAFSFEYEVSKYLLMVLSGMALATSGVVYQGSTNNPMAAPSTLGVMAGGSLGSMLFIIFYQAPVALTALNEGPSTYSDRVAALSQLGFLDQMTYYYGDAFCSLIGCFAVVGLVLVISLVSGRGHISRVGLVVAGQVFTMILDGVSTFIRLWAINNCDASVVEALTERAAMSFSTGRHLTYVAVAAVPMLVGFAIIFANRKKLNLLSFSEEEARSMGVSSTRLRNVSVITCTALTAMAISFCGGVRFLGFIVPHLVRRYVGPDTTYLVPATMLAGPLTLIVAYKAASLAGVPDIGISLLISVIACACFLVTSIWQRGRGNVEWL